MWEHNHLGEGLCATTRRFLDPEWRGLHNDEIPLRPFLTRLASGEDFSSFDKKRTEAVRAMGRTLQACALESD